MPKAWSSKDERQYEHIKSGEKALGRSTRRAKQIAAATVNKQRSAEGRTKEQKEARAGKKKTRTRTAARTRSTAGRRKPASTGRKTTGRRKTASRRKTTARRPSPTSRSRS